MSSDHFDQARTARRYEMMFGFGTRRPINVLRVEGLPEPLQAVADAMYDAKTDDEAKAAASEFLTLSEEWVDSHRQPEEAS
jgi:hypothetical protein